MTPALVAVIGAGCAGLAAAREIRRLGHDVVVLESRGRAGGRVDTRYVHGVPVPIELGAEFIHGDAPETYRILRDLVTPSVRVPREVGFAHDGRVQVGDFGSSVDRVLGLADRRRRDESVASFLARRPGGKSLAEKRVETAEFVEGFHAADLSTIGIRSITPEPGESATAQATNVSRPVQGYDTIVEAWVRELGRAIRLRTTVHEVSWQRRRVELVTRSRGRIVRLQARAAVITAPIGVLQRTAHERGGIRFHPDPSRIRSAIEHLAMGSVTKLAVEFDGFPWADLVRGRKHEALERLSFLQVPGGVFNVWWTMAPMRCPLAIAWSGGPPALALAQRKHTEIVTIAVRELAHALGVPTRRIASRVRRTWLHDWQNDPFARGAYSYARVGGADAGEALARPVEGTLFFAGEATDAASGTVEGAIASGRRAARQVARAL